MQIMRYFFTSGLALLLFGFILSVQAAAVDSVIPLNEHSRQAALGTSFFHFVKELEPRSEMICKDALPTELFDMILNAVRLLPQKETTSLLGLYWANHAMRGAVRDYLSSHGVANTLAPRLTADLLSDLRVSEKDLVLSEYQRFVLSKVTHWMVPSDLVNLMSVDVAPEVLAVTRRIAFILRQMTSLQHFEFDMKSSEFRLHDELFGMLNDVFKDGREPLHGLTFRYVYLPSVTHQLSSLSASIRSSVRAIEVKDVRTVPESQLRAFQGALESFANLQHVNVYTEAPRSDFLTTFPVHYNVIFPPSPLKWQLKPITFSEHTVRAARMLRIVEVQRISNDIWSPPDADNAALGYFLARERLRDRIGDQA